MEVTALRQYRRYLESIDREVRNTPKSEYIDVLSPGEVLDLLTIRDEISQTELSAEEKRELNSLDDLLIRHYWLIAQNIPVTDEPRSRWWWHLHEGPEVRERASYLTTDGEEAEDQDGSHADIWKTTKRAIFLIYFDRHGEYRWRLKDSNGKIIADSAEGYSSKWNCERAIVNLKREVGDAVIADSAR